MLRGRLLNRQAAAGYGIPEGFTNALLDSDMTDEEWMQLQWELMVQEEEEEQRVIAESVAEAEAASAAAATAGAAATADGTLQRGNADVEREVGYDIIDLTGLDDEEQEEPVYVGGGSTSPAQQAVTVPAEDAQPEVAVQAVGNGPCVPTDSSTLSNQSRSAGHHHTVLIGTAHPVIPTPPVPAVRDQGVQTESTDLNDVILEQKRMLDGDDEDGANKRLRTDVETRQTSGHFGSAPSAQARHGAHLEVESEEEDFILVPRASPTPAHDVERDEEAEEFILIPRHQEARSVSATPTLRGDDD